MTELKLNIPTGTHQLNPKQLKAVSWLFLLGLSEIEFLVKAFLFLNLEPGTWNLKQICSPINQLKNPSS
jgi:hypothetical protein